MSCLPDQFHHFFLELGAQRNDMVQVVRPHDQDVFIALFHQIVNLTQT